MLKCAQSDAASFTLETGGIEGAEISNLTVYNSSASDITLTFQGYKSGGGLLLTFQEVTVRAGKTHPFQYNVALNRDDELRISGNDGGVNLQYVYHFQDSTLRTFTGVIYDGTNSHSLIGASQYIQPERSPVNIFNTETSASPIELTADDDNLVNIFKVQSLGGRQSRTLSTPPLSPNDSIAVDNSVANTFHITAFPKFNKSDWTSSAISASNQYTLHPNGKYGGFYSAGIGPDADGNSMKDSSLYNFLVDTAANPVTYGYMMQRGQRNNNWQDNWLGNAAVYYKYQNPIPIKVFWTSSMEQYTGTPGNGYSSTFMGPIYLIGYGNAANSYLQPGYAANRVPFYWDRGLQGLSNAGFTISPITAQN